MNEAKAEHDEDLRAAREFAIELWSENYLKLRDVTAIEAGIMDDAHDAAIFAVNADSRAATILTVSFVEDTLKKVFQDHWSLASENDRERFFEGHGPLATFSQRGLVARALGWITTEQLSELSSLRRVRNEFAHNHRVHKLEDPAMSKLLMPLQKREEAWRQNEGYARAYDAASPETQLRVRLFCAAMLITSSLVANAKLQGAQLPVNFRPDKRGWDMLLGVEQAFIDAAIRFCWLSLGLGYTGAVYQYQREQVGGG